MRPSKPSSSDAKPSLASELYAGKRAVTERHRHRYEVNPDFIDTFEAAGLYFTGRDERGIRMEIAELAREVHPYYVATQYHPEFKSHPHNPSPPFLGLIAAATGQYDNLTSYQASALVSPISPVRPVKRPTVDAPADCDDTSPEHDKPVMSG